MSTPNPSGNHTISSLKKAGKNVKIQSGKKKKLKENITTMYNMHHIMGTVSGKQGFCTAQNVTLYINDWDNNESVSCT